MKYLAVFWAAVALSFLAAPAWANETACEVAPRIASFDPKPAELKHQASFINLWWNSEEAKAMSFDDRKAQREKDIASFFAQYENARRDAYRNAGCLVTATKKCASTSGHKHSCPMNFSPPANMRFVQSTLKAIDDDFDEWPHFASDGSVSFTNKKTGAGSNTDGFQAMAEYRPDYVDTAVAADMKIVHDAVDNMLFNVKLEG